MPLMLYAHGYFGYTKLLEVATFSAIAHERLVPTKTWLPCRRFLLNSIPVLTRSPEKQWYRTTKHMKDETWYREYPQHKRKLTLGGQAAERFYQR